MSKNYKNEDFLSKKGIIHFVLIHSYLIYFFAIILAVFFDIFIPTTFFQNPVFQEIGIILIILGTVLVFWAQSSSNSSSKKTNFKNLTVKSFENGPYKYFPNPTHLGLFIMTLGLGFIINSPFSIVFVIIAHILVRLIFVEKQEKLLERKYGKTYLKYKNKFNKWL